jgi:hypothetical protein
VILTHARPAVGINWQRRQPIPARFAVAARGLKVILATLPGVRFCEIAWASNASKESEGVGPTRHRSSMIAS